MSETWQQTKERLKQRGITILLEKREPEPPKPRYEEPKAEPIEPKFDLRRIVLPGGQTDYLVFNTTLKNIEWWLEHKTRFKEKNFISPIIGIEPVVFYEPVPTGATGLERSIYYNKKPVAINENLP